MWSPDSHYVALTADRTKYRCEVKLFRVEHGKISEIALPANMDAKNYLSADTKKHLGSLAFEGMHVTRWIDNSKIEIVPRPQLVASTVPRVKTLHSRGVAKIIETHREGGA